MEAGLSERWGGAVGARPWWRMRGGHDVIYPRKWNEACEEESDERRREEERRGAEQEKRLAERWDGLREPGCRTEGVERTCRRGLSQGDGPRRLGGRGSLNFALSFSSFT